MIDIGNELNRKGINYLWLVFTNDTEAIDNPNIVYMEPTLNIRPYLAMVKGRGYGVQVSDCEGDCYFTRECEALGLPLIVTPIKSFKEQGLEEGKNCYYIPFDTKFKDMKVDRFKKIPEYEGYIKPDSWDKILVDSKSNYESILNKRFLVRATTEYEARGIYDAQLERIPTPEDTWEIDGDRLEYLQGDNIYNTRFVEVIKEVKQNTKK